MKAKWQLKEESTRIDVTTLERKRLFQRRNCISNFSLPYWPRNSTCDNSSSHSHTHTPGHYFFSSKIRTELIFNIFLQFTNSLRTKFLVLLFFTLPVDALIFYFLHHFFIEVGAKVTLRSNILRFSLFGCCWWLDVSWNNVTKVETSRSPAIRESKEKFVVT